MSLLAGVASQAGNTVASTDSAAGLDSPTSWRLLARARRGDSDALGQLVSRYLPELHRWAHGRLPQWARSAVDTSDLIQDVIVRTLTRLDAFQPHGRRALAAYLREAVRNRIRDEHRRAARRPQAPLLPDTPASSRSSPLDRAMARDAERRYHAALAQLGQRERELVVAHIELDYTHEQLGCMIGRSPNAARMALCRAIDRLAALMREC
jgi:RNA polymerase sigma factor (sigma-70 family)